MKKHSDLLLLPLLTLLLGCGDSPPPSKPKEPATPTAVADPAPAPAPVPAAPDPTAAAVPQNPSAAPSSAPATAAGAPGAAPAPKVVAVDEFAPDLVGGKSIGKWVEQLNSTKKDDIIEALGALEMVGKKAEKASPKVTELSQNSDKEIAAEAAVALKAINGK